MNKKKRKAVVISLISIVLIAVIAFLCYVYVLPHFYEAKQPITANTPPLEKVVDKPKDIEILSISSGNLYSILCSIPFKSGDVVWDVHGKKFVLTYGDKKKEISLDKEYTVYSDSISAFETFYLIKINLQEKVINESSD